MRKRNLSENDAPTANRSKRPASKCTNGRQSKKRRATVPHAVTPTHEITIGLLFPLGSKIDGRNDRFHKLLDCFGRVPQLILYGNSLPGEIDVELVLISEKSKGVYYYSVYQFVEYQKNLTGEVFMSKLRRRVAVEMLYDGIGIIRLDNIFIQNQRSKILKKPDKKEFPLKSYPSDEEKRIRARGPTVFVNKYNLAKPCLAIRLFPTDPSVPIKITTSEGDRCIFFSNVLTPVPNLPQPTLDDRSKIKVKCCNSSAFVGPDGQNRFSIDFNITFPDEMLDELKSHGKWLEISLLDGQELHHSYFIQTEDGDSNSMCLNIQHTTFPLTVIILEHKLPISEGVISTESVDNVPTVLAHLANVPIRTTNEVMPTTSLKVRFKLVHTKPDANGGRKIIDFADMPIWENIIKIGPDSAYCDISNNQSNASNAILSEQPVVITMGTYIVEFDYIAKSSDELTIRKGDIITDAIPAEQGWLKGECRGTFGHFPENFVTPLTKEKAKNRTFANELGARLQSAVNGNNIGNKSGTLRKRPTNDDTLFQTQQSNNLPNGTLFQVKVAYAYTPVHDDELPINPNDIVNVTRMVEEGWYEGILDGKLGLFPSNYVTRITEENGSKKDPPVKRKPVNGVGVMFNKDVGKSTSPTSMETPSSHPKTPPSQASKKTTPIKARVLFDYKKSADDELSLAVGDIVTVLEKHLEDDGWWKGELNGRIGVFPDNYVEELPPSTMPSINTKHRPNTPESGGRNLSQTLPKTKLTNGDSSHDFSNDSHHVKGTSISDEEGYSTRNHYAEINNLDAVGTTEKLGGFNKARPSSSKRPPSSTIRKNENGFGKTNGSHEETNHNSHPQFNDIKNDNKVHTPSPPSSQREPGQLESPRYTNRPSSLHSTLVTNNHQGNSSLNGTTEIVPTVTNSSYVNSNLYNSNGTITVEQLHKDFQKMKVSLDEMKIKFTDQIRDLVGELDEEKKARATLQIELERLQKQIQKSSLVN
ncbi:unnamed protein product [Adineta ricciae]|uniref:SH3 domain-containing protein n=1 Tax=Adineta ricciae TaxID=249248 RepID=A0A815JJ43_ADIRI|nr:unnamed protein product [Adineta ricciae]